MARSVSRWHDSLTSTPKWSKLEKTVARRDGRKITAKYPDVCDECGHPIAVGESIWWSKGAPPCHEACVESTGITQYRTSSQIVEQELAIDRRIREELERQEADELLEHRLLMQEEGE